MISVIEFPAVGSGQGGLPVVLIHAFPVNAQMWRPVAEILAAAGHDVLLPELPGFGASEPSAEPPSMAVLADAVLAALDERGIDRCVMGGLSMGGYVAMELMRQAPERLAAVILADTKAGQDAPEARANRFRVADAVLAAGDTRALAAAMLPNLVGATTTADRPDAVAAVAKMIDDSAPAAVAFAQRAMADRPDSLATLRGFPRPVLVVWGDEDVISPKADQDLMLEAMAENPGASIATIGGVGHLSAIEDPQAVAASLNDFLARVQVT